MEETLSSDYGPGTRQLAIVIWLVPSSVIVWSLAGSIRQGQLDRIVVNLLAWVIVTLMVWYGSREPTRVTLVADVLRVRHGRRIQDIPLWRVHSVELDFPKRARSILLLVEPEESGDRSFESVEFIPRDVGLGFGGRDVADYLRRRVAEARASRAAT